MLACAKSGAQQARPAGWRPAAHGAAAQGGAAGRAGRGARRRGGLCRAGRRGGRAAAAGPGAGALADGGRAAGDAGAPPGLRTGPISGGVCGAPTHLCLMIPQARPAPPDGGWLGGQRVRHIARARHCPCLPGGCSVQVACGRLEAQCRTRRQRAGAPDGARRGHRAGRRRRQLRALRHGRDARRARAPTFASLTACPSLVTFACQAPVALLNTRPTT